MSFSRNAAVRRILSPLALAAVAVVAVQAPAFAQKKEKAAPAPKASYSKEFVAAYRPVEAQLNAAGADLAALKGVATALLAVTKSPDEQAATGRVLFNIGQKSSDYALALQGAELVIASGKAEPAQHAQFNYVAAQLAYNMKDYAKARSFTEAAIKAGYTENDPEMLLAETYFAQDQHAQGLKYLNEVLAARKAAGQPVNEAWIKRGLALAYNNDLKAEAHQWSLMYAREFPSQSSWGDAVAILINTADYPAAEMLDLLRLARRTNAMRTRAQYLEYVDAADPRKLPNEVVAVLDAGVAAKLLDNNLQTVKDYRASAVARIAADKAELPALQRDANAAGAKLVTVMAAADTLLSYGRYAEAEAMYAKAAAMPGANVQLALTRQGIAQVEQGKHAEAQATFAKVQGPRQAIANLWSLYAAQKASGTTVAAATVS